MCRLRDRTETCNGDVSVSAWRASYPRLDFGEAIPNMMVRAMRRRCEVVGTIWGADGGRNRACAMIDSGVRVVTVP